MTDAIHNHARLGLGTYRGSEDSSTDEIMCEIVQLAFRLGIRVVDTAVNYRSGRSEGAVGRALALAIKEKTVRREDILVCTKGGFTRPGLGTVPAPEVHGPLDHCFRPVCLRYQLELSLRTLGIEKIDVYYLHNPERQREISSPEEFQQIMREAFKVLERAAAEKLIGAYGISTWTGAKADAGLSIESLKTLARVVAADACSAADHFSYVQAPLSINMREALIRQHDFNGGHVSLLKLCEVLRLTFVASAAAGGGRVPALATTSVKWVRSVPGVDTALVGTLAPDHLASLTP